MACCPWPLGVAIAPTPIIAVLLVLPAPKAAGTSAGFLAGWVVGIVATTTVFLLWRDARPRQQ